MYPVKAPKKLIEVALPLDAINVAAAREKSIRHGHPSTLHLWWARRPLAAARAVLFAQLVNDPGYQQGAGFRYGVNKEKAALERERLFKIIEDLVQWENTNNEEVLERARAEIRRSWRETCELNKNHPQAAELFNPDKLPGFHDPFAGGGTIPLEAQRLGLESYASDLNPVAVTINKVMIEIPPRFAGRAPVGPLLAGDKQAKLHEDWRGARGLAEDVRRYGAWMHAEAEKRIGHLYPKISITAEMAAERPDLQRYQGETLTVIAWLWARTVRSPNPAFSDADAVPLAATFVLASKEGKEAYVEPVVEGHHYRFTVVAGVASEDAKRGTKVAGRGANFICLLSGAPISGDYIKAMAAGAENRDFFGIAYGKEDGRYVGFSYGKRTSLIMDSSLLLIEPVAAGAYMEALRAAEEASTTQSADTSGNTATGSLPTGNGTPRADDVVKDGYATSGPTAGQAVKKQFYSSIELDPFLAKKQFADLVDEVVQQFTMRPGVKVKIAIEIQAESPTGFDDGLQRAVKENCNVLKFKNAEFEAGE